MPPGESGIMTDWYSERATSERHLHDLQYKRHADSLMFRVTFASTIIALLAAAAAFWSGYEAHKARVDDERPFLAFDLVPWGPNDKIISPILDAHVTAFGKSPARDIYLACATIHENDLMNVAWKPDNNYTYMNISYILPSRFAQISCASQPVQKGKNEFDVIFGIVAYHDDAKHYYQTPFCFDIAVSPFTGPVTRPCTTDHGLPDLR
jgi:hypothetical protein